LSQQCEFEVVPEPLVTRTTFASNRMSHHYNLKRDKSLPYFENKYRHLAAEYGLLSERKFMWLLNHLVGMAALTAGEYRDAIRYSIKALLYYPFKIKTYILLLTSLGGGRIYSIVQKAHKISKWD